MMKIIYPLAFVVLSVAAVMAAAHRAGPGFLYTRTRGRCSPEYWSSQREPWPKMVPRDSIVSNIFGTRAFEPYWKDMTLMEAADGGGDDEYAWLLKESTAALLNSYARNGYPYAAWEVKTLVIQALVSRQTAALQARKFLEANENCG